MDIINKKASVYGLLIGSLIFLSWYLLAVYNQPRQVAALSKGEGLHNQQSAKSDSMMNETLALKKASALTQEAKIVGQLNKFAHEMQILSDRLDKLAQVSNRAQEANEEMAQMEELNQEEQEEEVKAQVADQLALFDRVAEREGVDQKWAAAAQEEVYQSFQNIKESGIGLSEVKCHSSICQARFSLDSEGSNASLQKLQEITPWEGESFIWIEDADLGEGVIYLAREGEKLPN